MKKERKEKHFIQKPSYKGGPSALKKFISKNLKYPAEAKKHKIEGTVYIKYDINYKGKVVGTHILTSLGYGCDEEAKRLVKLLEFDVPKTRKVKVLFQKKIQIHFRLPKNKPTPKPKPKTVSYNYTTSSATSTAKKGSIEQEKSNTYTYTIRID